MTIIERLQSTGIRRLGTPKRGFRYRHADGRAVSRADRERIEQLKIPPAWTTVVIHTSTRSAVQAVGLDAAERWQYLYHRAHVVKRERRKQERLVRFIQALPLMRRARARHLALPGLAREKVLASILVILGSCFLRSGSEQYASENGSYGIATLKRRHVTVRGDRVIFDFEGKSGQRQQTDIRNRRVAKLVRELLRHPGEVFKFRADEGTMVDVRTRHINAYIKEVMGETFSAKDFRTWAANVLCACGLARAANGSTTSVPERRKQIVTVVREVAGYLGHTPAVCRTSYIFDTLLQSYEKGRAVRSYCNDPASIVNGSTRGLVRSERALVTILRQAAA